MAFYKIIVRFPHLTVTLFLALIVFCWSLPSLIDLCFPPPQDILYRHELLSPKIHLYVVKRFPHRNEKNPDQKIYYYYYLSIKRIHGDPLKMIFDPVFVAENPNAIFSLIGNPNISNPAIHIQYHGEIYSFSNDCEIDNRDETIWPHLSLDADNG